MDHRAPPPPPEQLLPYSAAVVPVTRRRRSQRSARQQAAIPPVVVPPPAALPVPPSGPRQIPAPPAAAAAGGGAADADADNSLLMLLANTAVSLADGVAVGGPPSRRPAPAPAGDERRVRLRFRFSPPLAPAAAAAANAPPLPPPLAVDEPQLSLSMGRHGDAAAKASAQDCKKAACPQGDNAGSSNGGHHGGGVASPLPAAGTGPSPMQLDDDDEDLEPGEIAPEKPAAGHSCNADPAAHGSFLAGQDVEMAAWDEEAAKTIAGGEPAAELLSAEEEKRKREVFVGGLSRDAVEDDVRAALSAAGEITQVRMFPDRLTGKNKGYCFVAYRDAAMATKAVAELGDVKVCGKACRVAIPEGNQIKAKIAQRDPTIEQRQPSPTLVAPSSYITSWNHHARHENNTCSSRFNYVAPPVVAGYYYPMYNGNIVYLPPRPDLNHQGLLGSGPPSGRSQMGQSGYSSRPAWQPHRSRN